MARLTALLLLLTCAGPSIALAYPKMVETAPRLENGYMCYETFVWTATGARELPTVAAARASCKDIGASLFRGARELKPMHLRDVAAFFQKVRDRFDRTSMAKTFSFFVEAGQYCYRVKFKAYEISRDGSKAYRTMQVNFRSLHTVECPLNEPDPEVDNVACTAVNCTRLPPATTTAPSGATRPGEATVDRSRPCARIGEDAVSMADFRESRLTYIIALVGCNLLSFAFLAATIHYCFKWRHLRRLYRLARSAGSLAGTAASPPAVRHLGPAGSGNGTASTYAGGYPDYHYSSIARRKALQHQPHPTRTDDDLLSYRSDHTKTGGSLYRQLPPPTSLRHGAISPPRGWGNCEAPSTPGSIRRNGSISQMSMASVGGNPRRNGSLPAPPHPPPPPPPPIPSGFADSRQMGGY